MKYTFFNGGSVTQFNPHQSARDRFGQKIVKADGKNMTMLEFHLDLVQSSGRRDVYILDNKGREVLPVVIAQAA